MMRAVQFVEKRVKPHVVFRAVAMFAGVNDVVNALDFVARRAPVVDPQAFGNDVFRGQVFGRAAIHTRLVRFNELHIFAQNVRPRLFLVAQLTKSLFDETVMFLFRRRIVARLHRAFGDDFGVLVKDQILNGFDFPIGHGENSFWLKYLAQSIGHKETEQEGFSENPLCACVKTRNPLFFSHLSSAIVPTANRA